MRVVGTAGHVDHGKSTLVKALTGIDPDRLKEEKEREMTIDLGFAWLTLPSGEIVSIVDVPGHEAFIKNMLAGVGGIDAALFVIAADEGMMPQTLEHLAILDLLQIKGGVIALTKIDALQEREWIELVTADVRKRIAETLLAKAKIVPVSAKTREGLDALLTELDLVLKDVSPRSDFGKPRLSIDRVFSMPGFGTVVTGTLIDGTFAVGQEVEIIPGGKRGRIRGLQSHKEKIERATPGRRVAMNLSGLSVDDLQRGQVVALQGSLSATTLLDARIQYLASAPKPLTHNASVDFFVGSAEVPARVRLLDKQQLKPGDSAWIQLHLEKPVALAKHDRFIIRLPSPSITIGGGSVVEPNSRTRHRRFRPEVVTRLETLARGTPEEIILQFLSARQMNPADAKEIASGTGLSLENAKSILEAQVQSAGVIAFGAGESRNFLTLAGWSNLSAKITGILAEFHRQFPLRAGLPREEMKSRLGFSPRVFDQIIERSAADKILVAREELLHRPDFAVSLGADLQRKVDALLTQFNQSPYSPPSAQDAEGAIGSETLNALVAQNKLVRLNESVLLSPKAFEAMREWVVATIRSKGQIIASEVRDHFGTSRKYAIALLEYLDEKRITKRVGDARLLR